MELKSMALSQEQKQEYAEPTVLADAPKYPYGLELRLDGEILERLGLPALPGVGQKMMLHARVEVVSVSQHESQQGGKNACLCLQITEMALEKDAEKKEKAPMESKLYG